MRIYKVVILFLALVAAISSEPLTVDVVEFPPFIMHTDSGFEGFSIDLWRQIALENEFEYEINLVEHFSDIVTNLKEGKSDVGIAGISITSQRENLIDFAHSHITTGIGIMIEKDQNKVWTLIKTNIIFYGRLLLKLVPFVLAWFAYIYFLGLILWKLEIGNEMFADDFYNGFPDARFFVHVVISSTGFGNQIPLSKWGRRVTVLLMYSGIGFMFPLITGKVASEMTKKAPYVYIDSLDDLRQKRVAVIENTTSVGLVKSVEATPLHVKSISEARLRLRAGDCDAVVYDKPVLQYMAQKDKKLEVIDGHFNEESYGIALTPGSAILEGINQSVLRNKENGNINNLKHKWF